MENTEICIFAIVYRKPSQMLESLVELGPRNEYEDKMKNIKQENCEIFLDICQGESDLSPCGSSPYELVDHICIFANVIAQAHSMDIARSAGNIIRLEPKNITHKPINVIGRAATSARM